MDEDEVFEGESGSLCKVQASMAPRLTLSLSGMQKAITQEIEAHRGAAMNAIFETEYG